uniref:DUF5641 domain-containing protein n=1 Tax=Anopheles funestus TaxID=62324 RepID=A0A182RL83_ANOFN
MVSHLTAIPKESIFDSFLRAPHISADSAIKSLKEASEGDSWKCSAAARRFGNTSSSGGRSSTEYLSGLHPRTKWTKKRDNIREGTTLLLKEDNLPPLKWRYGRVIKVYPGDDGLIRVVDVKTAKKKKKKKMTRQRTVNIEGLFREFACYQGNPNRQLRKMVETDRSTGG